MAGSISTAHHLVAAVPDHLRRRLSSARELGRRLEETYRTRPTGAAPLDRLLRGGPQRGQLIEIVGRNGSGRFSIALAALAATTACGEAAVLIDLGDTLDPQNAVDLGADLRRLLWVRPQHLKPALHAAESAVGAGFPLVVIDLGVPPVPGGRGAEAAWLRLARSAAKWECILILTTPYRVSGTAAATVLRTEKGRPRWSGRGSSPRLLEGLCARIELAKTRHRPRNLIEGDAIEPFALSSTVSPLAGLQQPLLHPEPCASSAC